MKSYVHGDSFTLQEFRDAGAGLRPSHEKLLQLVDTNDPAWPHIAAALREMTDAGIEIDESAISIAARLGGHRLAELDATKRPDRKVIYETPPLATAGSIVYYIRRGQVIKIGTTRAPGMRFAALMPDEILAFEPGTAKEEKMRHRQFHHLRCQGEHFKPEPELTEHARQLRHVHGDPDPSWPTVAGLIKTRAAREEMGPGFGLPDPASGVKLTAMEARSCLGINRGTLSSWVYHKAITPAGRNDRGLQLFHFEHLVALHDKPAAVRSRAAARRWRDELDNGATQ